LTVKIFARQELIAAFRQLGLEAGDSLIVHSSYRSIAPAEGGPAGVVDALLETIGPAGNLMLPTFNYTRPAPEPWFDPATTPCRTGIIPESARQRAEAIRSLHPTHSVAVIGPDAESLTAGHLNVRAFGIGSPIDKLADLGGKVLLLGVGHVSNSAIHVAEEHAGIPKASYYDPLPVFRIRPQNGEIIEHPLDTSPSCSAAFGGAEGALRRHGLIADARIHGAKVQLMSARELITIVAEQLRETPDLLLCRWRDCKPCVGARKLLAEACRHANAD
jgi:aminoglycoside 3-N-acetyltransferase